MTDVLNDMHAERLLEAWERHGEFGPAFVEVYEAVTGATDKLAEILRGGATVNTVTAAARSFANARGRETFTQQRRAILDLRAAGLTLQQCARLLDTDIDTLVATAHHLGVAGHGPEVFLLLDEMLVKGEFTAKEIADATGLTPQLVGKLAHRINRPCRNGYWRKATDEQLYECRRLHFVEGYPKNEAVRLAGLSRNCGYAALRTENGVRDGMVE